MRPSTTVPRAALSATVAVLLLSACSSSDDDAGTASPAGSSSASASGTAPPSTPDDEVQAFCTEAEAVFTRVGNAFNSVTDAAAFTSVLDQGIAAFDQVEPPAEIRPDWSVLQQGLDDLRSTVTGADLDTPAGQAALQEAVTAFQTDVAEPQQNLERFITANCDNAATGSAPSTTG